MTSETTIHRALADEHRRRIVEELRERPLDVRELARRLALHPNTVRFHLARLREAGLVSSHPESRAAPGRPRLLYGLRAGAGHDGAAEQRLLAAMLTDALAGAPDGATRAEEAGRRWGRYAVPRPSPLERPDAEAVHAALAALLAEHGFEPERTTGAIRMRRCPFRELAGTSPGLICAAHRGLLAGALEELGGELELGSLEIFPEPDVCVARVQRRRSGSGG